MARRHRITLSTIVATLLCLGGTPGRAEQSDQQQMRGLDEQVQEIKSDVLGISQELSRLEEKLLYPSNTQLAVFVTIEKGNAARLDAIQIQIDGQPDATSDSREVNDGIGGATDGQQHSEGILDRLTRHDLIQSDA